MFDVESDPHYQLSKIDRKLERANILNSHKNVPEPHVITKDEYIEWSEFIYAHATVFEASDYIWSDMKKRMHYRNHAIKMMRIADESENPDEIMKAHRFLDNHQKIIDDRHNLDHYRRMRELKQWIRVKGEKEDPNIIDVTRKKMPVLPGEKQAAE